jgi:hypothetical protein
VNLGLGLIAALSVLQEKHPELFVPQPPDCEFDQNAREKFRAASNVWSSGTTV